MNAIYDTISNITHFIKNRFYFLKMKKKIERKKERKKEIETIKETQYNPMKFIRIKTKSNTPHVHILQS